MGIYDTANPDKKLNTAYQRSTCLTFIHFFVIYRKFMGIATLGSIPGRGKIFLFSTASTPILRPT
jgi:hypothetical protein